MKEKIIKSVLISKETCKKYLMTDTEYCEMVNYQRGNARDKFNLSRFSNSDKYEFKFVIDNEKDKYTFKGYAIWKENLKIVNCTAHQLTGEQLADLKAKWKDAEIVDLPEGLKKKLIQCPSDGDKLDKLTSELVEYISSPSIIRVVFPIGSPAFMFRVACRISHSIGVWEKVLFSHSERESVEKKEMDGSISKVSRFKHIKFITA